MADVFVSYARTEKERAAPLVAAIEAKGWSVWWDPEISAGQLFDDQIEAALRLDPESFEVNTAAARLYFTQRRFADAIKYYEKSAALMETDFSSVSMLMTSYKVLGDLERTRLAAQRTLARAEKITSQEPDNGMALGYVVVSLCVLGEAERAKDLAKRAMLLDPDNLTMRYNFA